MARPLRLQIEDTLYHIICRGNYRQKVFFQESDYERYLGNLEKAKERYGFYLYAYALMTNHIHLLIETPQANIAQIMHSLNTAYATYVSMKYKKSGHLFQGRYKSVIVDKDSYLLDLTAYIHLNPVHAGMVKRPEEYQWSSYTAYQKRHNEGLVSWNKLKTYLTHTPKEYQNYVNSRAKKKFQYEKKIYAGFILGSTRFIKDMLAELKLRGERSDVSYAKQIEQYFTIGEVVEGIGRLYRISPDLLYGSRKKRIREKKLALYAIKCLCSDTNREVGKRFGISDTAVIKAQRWTEAEMVQDRRTKKEVDGIISGFRG